MDEVCECCGLECIGDIQYSSAEDLWCCEACHEVLKAQQDFKDDVWAGEGEVP
jgi:hypothetical protein